jgi:hypothetical protein
MSADIAQRPRHVRYSPESGHLSARVPRPLSARSGHGERDEGVAVGRSSLIASPLREEDARNNAAGSQSFCLTLTHGSRR